MMSQPVTNVLAPIEHRIPKEFPDCVVLKLLDSRLEVSEVERN